MPFQLTIVAKEESGIVHALAEGEGTMHDFGPGSPHPFEPIMGPDWPAKRILVDFDRVPYIDSSAIGWLIGTQKQMRTAGGMLALHSVQPQVRQILDMLKIGRVVPVVDDLAAGRTLLLETLNTAR